MSRDGWRLGSRGSKVPWDPLYFQWGEMAGEEMEQLTISTSTEERIEDD